ncbi:hypothetical protein TURU_106375 [Turdus rufiventris]|nr:hypothetical protein TURU_106375 [Turdus rufiventris]
MQVRQSQDGTEASAEATHGTESQVHRYKDIFDANGDINVKEVIYKWIEKDLEQYMKARGDVCAELTGKPQEETSKLHRRSI